MFMNKICLNQTHLLLHVDSLPGPDRDPPLNVFVSCSFMSISHKIICTDYTAKNKGKGICLESRYPPGDIHLTTHVLQTLPALAVGAQQPATIDPTFDLCTRYQLWLVDRGSVEYKVYAKHMARTGNQTPDLLILSPMPYPLSHVLPQTLS